MKIDNSLGKTFGGPPLYAAYLFLITGILILFANISGGSSTIGFFMVLASCFVIFTTSGVEIETENHRVKQYNKIFGIIKAGKWKNLDSYIGVTLVHMKNVYTVASRANLTTSTTETDYRIFLVNKARRPAFAIKKCKTLEKAEDSLEEFSLWLKCPVFSPKRRQLNR